MGGHRRWLTGCVVVAIAAAMAVPGTAGAAVTFGADMTKTPANSTAALSFAPVVDPSGAPNTGAPISGVLVSVRVKTTGAANTGTIRVLTQTSHPDATTYGFLNTAPEISIPFTADADPAGHVTQVLTRRPIDMGQKLGWFMNDPGMATKVSYNDFPGECAFFGAPHPTGTEQNYGTGSCNNNIILESGTIEADADHDGYGDETQDACPTNGATHSTCPLPAKTKKKCKKKKKHHSAFAAKKKCKKKK
jgi:hypothetical protein